MPCSRMYLAILMPKNCVVTMRPASPYAAGRPQSSGRGSKAPRGCLSKPTASAISALPERIAFTADINALPPVAQPFLTFVNGIPVRPRSATRVSARPAPSLPPNATCTSVHARPASRSAACDGVEGELAAAACRAAGRTSTGRRRRSRLRCSCASPPSDRAGQRLVGGEPRHRLGGDERDLRLACRARRSRCSPGRPPPSRPRAARRSRPRTGRTRPPVRRTAGTSVRTAAR